MSSLLEQAGGGQLLRRMVSEFYLAIGKHLSDFETSEHMKQKSRQTKFLNHAFTSQSEPMHHDRASFLAQGLNPALFTALLEYIQARLAELGHSTHFSAKFVKIAESLYESCTHPLSIAS